VEVATPLYIDFVPELPLLWWDFTGTSGGGLGEGGGMGFTLDFDLERLVSPPRKVEVDEDDDSRTGARPRVFELP
jgi:hypothetical protein